MISWCYHIHMAGVVCSLQTFNTLLGLTLKEDVFTQVWRVIIPMYQKDQGICHCFVLKNMPINHLGRRNTWRFRKLGS
ncbi:hypothetical protein ACB098_01G307800 [Castanea mollissima]